MALLDTDTLRANYDSVAEAYAERFLHELESKPFDRELLTQFASGCPAGLIADVGCGPGHVGGFLASQGRAQVVGLDLAPRMIQVAQGLFPGLEFEVADVRAVERPDAVFSGVVAFYSLIHLPTPDLNTALRELFRLLEPAGRILIAFHVGAGEEVGTDDFLDAAVAMRATQFSPEVFLNAVLDAGFEQIATQFREPYENEYPSQRAYVSATKP